MNELSPPTLLLVTNFVKLTRFHDGDSQSSLTGESGTAEKTVDVKEGPSTPLLELRNICFMVSSTVVHNLNPRFLHSATCDV